MLLGILFAAAAGACWGLMFIAPIVLDAFTPLEITIGRFLVYGLVSLTLLAPRLLLSTQPPAWPRIGPLVWLAFTGSVGFYLLLTAAVQTLGVAATSLMIGLVPFVITLLGRKEQSSLPIQPLLLPLAAILVGVVLINLDALSKGASGEGLSLAQLLIGLFFAVAALISWSSFAVTNARFLKQNPSISSNQWSLWMGVAAGGLALLCLLLVLLDTYLRDPTHPYGLRSTQDWFLFAGVSLLIGLLGSVIGNLLWNAASRRLPVSLTAQVFIFEPLFALLYGFSHAQRFPRPLETLAIVLLISGVLLGIRAHRQPAKQLPAENPVH